MSSRTIALALGVLLTTGCAVRGTLDRLPNRGEPPAPAPTEALQNDPMPSRTSAGSSVGQTDAPPPAPPPRADSAQPAPGFTSAHVVPPEQAVSSRAAEEAHDPGSPPSDPPREPRAPGSPSAPPERANGTPNDTHGSLQLRIVPSASAIAPGDIVIVDVVASSSTPIVDAPLHLSFDAAVVEFVDGQAGDFLTAGGSSVVFLLDGRSRLGDVAVAVGRVDRTQGGRGTGLLCRMRFRGRTAGEAALRVEQAMAWGPAGRGVPVQSGGASVLVR